MTQKKVQKRSRKQMRLWHWEKSKITNSRNRRKQKSGGEMVENNLERKKVESKSRKISLTKRKGTSLITLKFCRKNVEETKQIWPLVLVKKIIMKTQILAYFIVLFVCVWTTPPRLVLRTYFWLCSQGSWNHGRLKGPYYVLGNQIWVNYMRLTNSTHWTPPQSLVTLAPNLSCRV